MLVPWYLAWTIINTFHELKNTGEVPDGTKELKAKFEMPIWHPHGDNKCQFIWVYSSGKRLLQHD